MQKLAVRELHLLCGHSSNPAEKIVRLLKEHQVGPLWAAKFLAVCKRENREIPWWEIDRWSSIEILNEGSYQRFELPEGVQEHLKGSGRWHAADSGGWFRLLLEASLRWQDLSEKAKRDWDRLAEALPPVDLEFVIKTEEQERSKGAFQIGCLKARAHGNFVEVDGERYLYERDYHVPPRHQNCAQKYKDEVFDLGEKGKLVLRVFQLSSDDYEVGPVGEWGLRFERKYQD